MQLNVSIVYGTLHLVLLSQKQACQMFVPHLARGLSQERYGRATLLWQPNTTKSSHPE